MHSALYGMGVCASGTTLSASQLESRIRAAKATRALNLRGCSLRAIPAAALALGSSLRMLDLSLNKDIDLSGLESFTQLRKLVVSGCGLGSVPNCSSFASTLEHLDASGNAINSLKGLKCPRLKVMVLAGNDLRGHLAELESCPKLVVSLSEFSTSSCGCSRLPRLMMRAIVGFGGEYGRRSWICPGIVR